jgi:hypothetical protein
MQPKIVMSWRYLAHYASGSQSTISLVQRNDCVGWLSEKSTLPRNFLTYIKAPEHVCQYCNLFAFGSLSFLRRETRIPVIYTIYCRATTRYTFIETDGRALSETLSLRVRSTSNTYRSVRINLDGEITIRSTITQYLYSKGSLYVLGVARHFLISFSVF